MTDTALVTDIRSDTLPGRAVPYVVRAGDGLSHNVAGQVIKTIAGSKETSGGFGAVVCHAGQDRFPIPMHWHEKEHDTWFCTRGKVQVWSGDDSRVLSPGDFAYVKPRGTHSYQCIAPRTSFFGIVAPGGWEQFFVEAGEVWGMTGLPPSDRPFDFSRMGPAMGKFGVMRVENPTYAPATPLDEADQQLPAGAESYFLEAGFGLRRALFGHLSTAVLTMAQTQGVLDMRVVEGGRGAAAPTLRHARTTVFLYLLEGELSVTLAGEEFHVSGGDGVNIPPGTSYATRVLSGTARWVAASAGGDGGEMWDQAGAETAAFCFPLDRDDAADLDKVRGLSHLDVAIA